MPMPMTLTDAEVAFLLMQPDVANVLAKFNRAAAYQAADANRRMECVNRARAFEKMDTRRRT